MFCLYKPFKHGNMLKEAALGTRLMVTQIDQTNKHKRKIYLMSDVRSYTSRISTTFYNHIFMLITVQQLKCFSDLEKANKQEFT